MTHPEGWRKGCSWILSSCLGQELGGSKHIIEKVPDKPRLFHWWNFTTKLEPILSEIAEAGNARPAELLRRGFG